MNVYRGEIVQKGMDVVGAHDIQCRKYRGRESGKPRVQARLTWSLEAGKTALGEAIQACANQESGSNGRRSPATMAASPSR